MAQYVLFHAMMTFFYCMAPLLAANLITVLVLEYLQVGFIFSFESVSPKLSKLNPIEGFKKYFQLKQYIELLKSVVKMFFVILIIVSSIKKTFFYGYSFPTITTLASGCFYWRIGDGLYC